MTRSAPTESDSLLHRQRKANRVRKSLLLLLLGLVIIAVCCIATMLFRHANQDEIDISQFKGATDSDGNYVVNYSQDIDEKTSLSEMAQIMLPPWYETSVYAVSKLTSDVGPDEVKAIRLCLLKTRDFLDVLSPIYTQKKWTRLRKLYKIGYESLGHFQDLDHANIKYDETLWEKRREDILFWKNIFLQYQKRHDVLLFLQNPLKNKCARRIRSSHLFWSDVGNLPCGSDMAKSSLQKLATVQLTKALNYLGTIMQYKSVLTLSKQQNYHNFRKELRSFLDEYDLFPMMLVPEENKEAIATLNTAKRFLGKINDKWTALHIYVENKEHETQQKKLEDGVDNDWDTFKTWTNDNDIEGTIQSVIDSFD
mmetsp:Transcript_26885/g.40693  ORF Transcript_26885/g.40693 Transcript_26885/m.40693 type:complete len:367 (-) Transcript_26885:348-1448(-)